jgi:hypothetical protein
MAPPKWLAAIFYIKITCFALFSYPPCVCRLPGFAALNAACDFWRATGEAAPAF